MLVNEALSAGSSLWHIAGHLAISIRGRAQTRNKSLTSPILLVAQSS
jgi:hypothetical protein